LSQIPARHRKIEPAGLTGHPGMEDHLKQQIAQFVPKTGLVVPFDRINDLAGFLQRVGGNTAEVLLPVPGAALIRVPQASHDIEQCRMVAGAQSSTGGGSYYQ
jgi:hypothetical protein